MEYQLLVWNQDDFNWVIVETHKNIHFAYIHCKSLAKALNKNVVIYMPDARYIVNEYDPKYNVFYYEGDRSERRSRKSKFNKFSTRPS